MGSIWYWLRIDPSKEEEGLAIFRLAMIDVWVVCEDFTNEVSPASGNFRVNPAGGTSSFKSGFSSTNNVLLYRVKFKWVGGLLTVRCMVQRFIQKTLEGNWDLKRGENKPVNFDKSKLSATICHKGKGILLKEGMQNQEGTQGKDPYGDNGKRNATTNEPSSQALVAQDGLGGYDWSNDFDEPVNYALMAISYLKIIKFILT
ncbi:hypothetical protein Tco_1523258 [Tanacetum coccineum]